jgi:hypothetical protein
MDDNTQRRRLSEGCKYFHNGNSEYERNLYRPSPFLALILARSGQKSFELLYMLPLSLAVRQGRQRPEGTFNLQH